MSEDDDRCFFLWCCRAKLTNSSEKNSNEKTGEEEAIQLTIGHDMKTNDINKDGIDKNIAKPNATPSPQNSNGSAKKEVKETVSEKSLTKEEDKSPVAVALSATNVEEDDLKCLANVEQLVSRLEELADTIVEKNDNTVAGQSSVVINDESEQPVVVEETSCWLENKQWTIANHNGNKDLVVQNTEVDQHVNIFRCNDSVVKIVGKVDSITIDGCSKCGILFDDVLASLNVANSDRLKIQVLGFVPSVSVNATDGLSLYLSREASTSPIFTSRCSELNILIPSEDDDRDLTEICIPEQFRSYWNGEKWITEVADIMK